ncbi:MAG TPA: hypothetical protein PKA13_17340 [Geminicoccaceae bacterium]|nr:hypothetical protein [Geminicoccus sp.]HMU51542.1 hypothetical protein [Geminicoccaceae bacterium]
MAERPSYPQLPSTVWWGVREILQRTPNVTIDERYLSIHLDVQEAAARQYLAELKRVGILTDEGKPTQVALRWRMSDTYSDAVEELISNAYPEGLRQVAPPGVADRQKAINWFMKDGLGAGSAKNKVATYLTIGASEPMDGVPSSKNGRRRNETANDSEAVKPRNRAKDNKSTSSVTRQSAQPNESRKAGARFDSIPLNVNVQIHIGADATSEQIESIFSAMRRYLHDERSS